MDHSTNEELYVTPDRFGISFSPPSDGVTVSVNFAPSPNATPLELAMLQKLIDQLGYAHLPIQQDKLVEVAYKQRANKEGFTIAISGHRDGSLEIETSKDRMNAMAYVHHPSGEGQPLTADIIKQQLTQSNVTYGISDEVIAALVEDQGRTMTDEIIIAQGTAPINGVDARFVSLVEGVAERRPPLLDDDPVDYREFGGVDTVAPGDRILRREPPTPGEAGYNVFGETIPPVAGKDKELKLNRSVQLDPEDPDIVIANIGGQPVITDRGGFVEKLVTLDDIDLKSGNIEFDGTVIVKGDVKSGMKVKASGDINVMGTVDAATMEAEGSVTVNGGIIGHGAVRDDKGNLRTGSGYVKAKGSVMARFYKNVIIESDDSIVARDTIEHCEINSRNQIVVGSRGGSARASIVGGTATALVLVQAPTIGSPASAHTTINVGYDPDAEQRVEAIETEIEESEKRLKDVDKMASFYKANPDKLKDGLMDRIVATQMRLIDDLVRLKDELKFVKDTANCMNKARIVVTNKIFSNVTLNFGKVSRVTNEDLEKGTFLLQDTWITYRKGKI